MITSKCRVFGTIEVDIETNIRFSTMVPKLGNGCVDFPRKLTDGGYWISPQKNLSTYFWTSSIQNQGAVYWVINLTPKKMNPNTNTPATSQGVWEFIPAKDNEESSPIMTSPAQ